MSWFFRTGVTLQSLNTKAWRRTLTKVGITDFHWHVQAGTPLHALQELGGWESVEMVRRYAHMAPDHLAELAERVTDQGTNITNSELKVV